MGEEAAIETHEIIARHRRQEHLLDDETGAFENRDAIRSRVQCEHPDMSRSGLNQSGEQTNGRGFSGPVAAQKSVNRTARYAHFEAVHGLRVAVLLLQRMRFDNEIAHGASPSSSYEFSSNCTSSSRDSRSCLASTASCVAR